MRGALAIALVVCIASTLVAAPPCQVHVILFVPNDVEVPAGYQQRMDETIDYTENFFIDGLKRWGHNDVVSPFRRTSDGHAEVTVVKGSKPASDYKDPSLKEEAIAAAKKDHPIDEARQVWWIFVYKGDPPNRFANYRGGFAPKIGGWSVCNYDSTPGKIDNAKPLGDKFLADLTLKGMIHELGHGFQLPHIGPRIGDKAGNTLMGPNHPSFRRIVKAPEPRVYLSEAAAALIAHHPTFRGVTDDRGRLPRLSVADMKYTVNRQEKAVDISGKVRANRRPMFAIVADESESRPGEYWTKHYVGKVKRDGSFSVRVSEPTRRGTFKTWFVFDNGATTGDGRKRGKMGAVSKEYRY